MPPTTPETPTPTPPHVKSPPSHTPSKPPKPPVLPPTPISPSPPATTPTKPPKTPPSSTPSPTPQTPNPPIAPLNPPTSPPPQPPVVPVTKPPPTTPTPTVPYPPATTTPTRPSGGTCPVGIVKLNVCIPILGGILGNPMQSNCCALLGLIGVDVEVCLCAAINANILGIININIPKIDIIATIVTTCGRKLPPDFSCP
ncbi:hypothetical protein KP509_26G041500 [Ceratopteris richardii]|nr:hypothetical protein KP509_26G041500 [Ceratopteris richardii]